MSLRRWRHTAGLTLALVGLLACKKSTTPLQPSIFTNPGEMALICFEAKDAKKYRNNPDLEPTLPLACCSKVIGTDAQIVAREVGCPDDDEDKQPIAHALVTQIPRGETAAVDLERKEILDSDRNVPGYSFVDVGGLPTAIVVPAKIPGDRDNREPLPPLWTYVAGRQTNSVRAVPSCRFIAGRACGPEREIPPEEFGQITRRALAGEPREMVASADGKGLWVSLPDAGLLAYVPLPTVSQKLTPFPGDIVYYALPGGLDGKPPAPVAESEPYRFLCRADNPQDRPDTWSPLLMPNSVAAESTRSPRPTLLRVVAERAPEEGESDPPKLLFVADEGQMVVHALAQEPDGSLSLRATLPVGAPLRDFAVTDDVPESAPSYEQLIDQGMFEATTAKKRYLYAIDNRDGSVMAFALAFSGGVPALTPLLAPRPARDSVHRTHNRADRLSLGGEGYVARALAVVDTRARIRSDGSLDDGYCGESIDGDDGFDFAKLRKDADALTKEWKALPDDSPEERLAKKRAEQDAVLATERADMIENAGASSLRGVFLMVSTSRGTLVALDIHDLDLACRATVQCDPTNQPDDEYGVALERHTTRLSGSSRPSVSVSPSSEVRTTRCPEGYGYAPDSDDRVCITQDPWMSRNLNLAVTYEGPFTSTIQSGVLEAVGRDRVRLKAPQGVDLCARGANAEDKLLIGILSQPDDEERRDPRCVLKELTTAPRLRVLEARRDELLLEPLPGDISLYDLFACYNEFVAFDLRLDDQYLVLSSTLTNIYQHNNMSAADGTCVRDESLDPRFTSRAQLGKTFVNQFVAFTLNGEGLGALPLLDAGRGEEPEADAGEPEAEAGPAEEPEPEGDAGAEEGAPSESELDDAKKEINPTLTLTLGTFPITAVINTATTRTDTLPNRVRYFPEAGGLFVVDQASQGLVRFLLTPEFEADTDSDFR